MYISRLGAVAVVGISVIGCSADNEGQFLAGGREVESWVIALDDASPQVRRNAVLKLGNVADEDDEVEPALIKALQDSNRIVRHDAVFAIFKLQSPGHAALQQLERMSCDDTDSEVREVAGRALMNIKQRN